MSIKDAIDHNGEGVRSMVEGNHREAAQRLSVSLATMRNMLQAPGTDWFNQSTQCTRNQENEKYFWRIHFMPYAFEVPTSLCLANDAPGFIFQQAITLTLETPSEDDDERIRGQSRVQLMNTHSACTIYNIALLQHRLAMFGDDSYRQRLNKAEAMYKMCIKLLSADGMVASLQDANSHIAMAILMVATNNLSQVQFLLGYCYEANQTVRNLLRLLYFGEARIPYYQMSLLQRIFSAKDWHGILSNGLLAGGTNVAPAA